MAVLLRCSVAVEEFRISKRNTRCDTCPYTYTYGVIESQNWTTYNAAQSEEKHRFVELLADLCNTVPQPEQVMGRPRLPLSDMLFAAACKVYVGFSARRFTSDLKDAHLRGLIGNAAHFNSVNRYMANPELTDALKTLITVSSLP